MNVDERSCLRALSSMTGFNRSPSPPASFSPLSYRPCLFVNSEPYGGQRTGFDGDDNSALIYHEMNGGQQGDDDDDLGFNTDTRGPPCAGLLECSSGAARFNSRSRQMMRRRYNATSVVRAPLAPTPSEAAAAAPTSGVVPDRKHEHVVAQPNLEDRP